MSKDRDDLPELPNGWIWTTVKEVIKIIDYRGRTPPFNDSGIPHLRSSNIRNGKIIWKDLKYVSEETYQEFMTRGLPQKGDVLFTTEGPLGEVALVPEQLFSVAQRMMILRPSKDILLSKFLLYQIASPIFQSRLKGEGTGTTVTGISSRNFQPLKIIAAPINEQKRIVAKIEALQKRSQRVKEAIDAIPQLLDQFRQSVLAAAFRGDLTADWRENNPDVEPASVLLEKIRAERRHKWEEAELEKMKVSGKTPKDDKWKKKYKDFKSIDDSELPELPEGWTWTSTENLSSFESNAICAGPFGTIFKAKDFRDSGIPIVFLRHVSPGKYLTHKPGFMDEKKWEEIFKPYSVWGGELLVTKLGEPPGICAMYPEKIGPAMVTPDVIKLSVNKDVSIPHYLMHYFNSEQSKRFAFGVAYGITRLRMNLSIFRTLPIPLAPFHEQQEVIRKIQSFFKAADIIEQQYQETKANLDQLNQSILAKAFRGELVPQNPNDEPASILLERIRAEREKLQQQTKAAKKSKGKTTKRRSKKAPQKPEESVQMELDLE